MTRREAFAEWWADSLRHCDDNIYKTEGAQGMAWRAFLSGYVDGLSQRNTTQEQRRKKRGA